MDYIPNTDDALITWLVNLKAKLPTYVTLLAITPARKTQIDAWIDALVASIQNAGQKKNDWLAASADKQTQMTASIGGLRMEIGQWKANPAITDAATADLQISGTSAPFDAEGYQASMTVQAFSGYVRVKFRKLGADGINLYSRIKGQTAWKFVSRDTNSPYDDHTPAAVPGTPEVREYQAFGVLNDEQIGQGSDIAVVTVAG